MSYKVYTVSIIKVFLGFTKAKSISSGVPRNFVWGVQQIQLRTERMGTWERHPPSQGLIFLIFGTLRLFMMTTNLFVNANVKQLRT